MVDYKGEGEPLDGQDDAEDGVGKSPDHAGRHVASANGASQLHSADLVEENPSCHCTKTHPSALHSPSYHQEEEGGGKEEQKVS